MVTLVPSWISAWGSREEDVEYARWFDGYDHSGVVLAWWYLSRISLGPYDHIV
jgi:hypothetical protein